MNPAVYMALMSSASASSSDEETTEETTEEYGYVNEGVLRIDLKDTEVITEERKGFFARIFLGKEVTFERENVTQYQYLEKIAEVFKELGYDNVLSVEVNGRTVYYDEENKENDLQEAIQAALEYEEKEAYHISIAFDTTKDEEENLVVDMYAQHKEGEIPLVVKAYFYETKSEEIKNILESIKSKINDKFGIESGEIEVDEDEVDEEGAEEEATEETSEEATEESSEESTEEEEKKEE